MKSLFSLLFFVLFSFCSNAQIVDIPDANFKAALIARNIDLNSDGEIQESEAEMVESLYLSSSNISDLTGISSFINLVVLTCEWNQLTTLEVNNLVNLENLICNGNQLTTLDVSALINLNQLICGNNNLTSLNIDGLNNIENLDCENNQLSSLDVSDLNELTDLRCRNNVLDTLNVSGLSNLTFIECNNNNLSELDLTGLTNLEYLQCEDNQLLSLDVNGLNNLSDLEFTNNQLTALNFTNCPSLISIYGENNNLTSLDFTGVATSFSNQSTFYFSSNNISSIVFPSGFEFSNLLMDDNQIVDLDLSNVISGSSNWYGNPIETVNIKNGVEDGFYDHNIDLYGVQFICADDFELEAIMDYYEVIEYDIPVSSYCTFEPGGEYNRITGSVRLDLDSNGCDASDTVIPNVLIEINDGTEQGFASTNLIGDYNAYVTVGDYTITPNIENASWYTAIPNSATVSFTDNNNLSVQDFCFKPVGVHQDVEITIAPANSAQPGFDATYQIVYKNKGNQITSGDIEFTFDATVLDYVSSSQSITSMTSGSLVWDYTNLYPFESRSITVTLNVNSPMETPAVNIGDQLEFLASIDIIGNDEIPDDNEFSYKQTVIGSFDPNDITCLEGDTVSPDKIGEYLHYNINFENTGTAAATFVVVKDVIDETNFDLSSLQIMYASHEIQTRVVDNKIEFVFDNINLGPDEKGNVVFKIKTLETLTVGDDVSQQAEIFFDYNFPIDTNLAVTSFQALSTDDFNIDTNISIFPNPAKELVTIEAKNIIKSIEIYDVHGRKVSSKLNDSKVISIDVAELTNGIYFLKIKSKIGQKVERLVKH